MNPYPDHLACPRDPLPADFGPELGRVDEAFAQAASGAPVPADLADRVFEASAARMPRPLLGPVTLRPAARRCGRPMSSWTNVDRGHLRLTWILFRPASGRALARE